MSLKAAMSPRRPGAGFTLVEILVSVIVLSLLASGLFSVFISGRYLVERSKRRRVAAEIARKEIENKRYLVSAAWDTGALDGSGVWSAWDGATYAPYRFRYRVENATGGAGWRKITVDVRWNESTI